MFTDDPAYMQHLTEKALTHVLSVEMAKGNSFAQSDTGLYVVKHDVPDAYEARYRARNGRDYPLATGSEPVLLGEREMWGAMRIAEGAVRRYRRLAEGKRDA